MARYFKTREAAERNAEIKELRLRRKQEKDLKDKGSVAGAPVAPVEKKSMPGGVLKRLLKRGDA